MLVKFSKSSVTHFVSQVNRIIIPLELKYFFNVLYFHWSEVGKKEKQSSTDSLRRRSAPPDIPSITNNPDVFLMAKHDLT